MKNKLLLIACILLCSGLAFAQEKPESAGKIMDDAYKTAAKEGKTVMIVFHASWCGWCKKFEASVNDPSCRDYFNNHFVIKYLDILERGDKKNLENPGAIEMYNQYGGQLGGVPFFLIFDKNGTLLADSKIKPAGSDPEKPLQNMGCPASDEEVAAFIKILEKTSRITNAEEASITERFKKNKS